MSWAAVSAFWACLVDPGGSTRVRATALVSFALAGTAVAMAGAGVASLGPGPAVAALFVMTIAGGLLRVYGAEASTIANILLVDAVYTVSRPIPSLGALVIFGLLFLAGCIWATALSLTVWRIHPFAAARQALAAAFRSLAALAMGLADVLPAPPGAPRWTAHAQHDRRVVREAIETARATIAQTTGERGGMGATGVRLSKGLNVAEGEFARLIALSDTLERRQVTDPDQRRRTVLVLKRLAAVFHRLDRFVEAADGADPHLLRLALDRVKHSAPSAPAAVSNLVLDCAHEAEQVLQDPDMSEWTDPEAPVGSKQRRPSWRQDLLDPLRAELTPDSLIFRHAVRMAISVAFAYLLTRIFRIPYGYWMTMTVVIIQQPYVATTWTRALERVLGSVLGGGLAALLGLVFHAQATLLVLIFPLAVATLAFRPVNYTLFVFFLTPLFVLILDLTHPEERELTLAGVRALNTVIGGVIALAGVTLIWPASGSDRMRLDLASAIERNGWFASLAISNPDDRARRLQSASFEPGLTTGGPNPIEGATARGLEAARRRAGLASNRAEASQQRAALESWWRRQELNGATKLLGGLRRLAGAATTLWLQPPDPQHRPDDRQAPPEVQSGAAQWAAQATAALAAAVRTAAPIPAPPPKAWQTVSGEHDVLIGEIEDLYRAAASMTRNDGSPGSARSIEAN